MRSWATHLALAVGLVVCSPVFAGAPDNSLRPVARPTQDQSARPDAMVLITRAPGVKISLRPLTRPGTLNAPAQPTQTQPAQAQPVQVASTARGSICGMRDIRGQKLTRIRGRLNGCGVQSPVQVTSVSGVTLSQPATLDCTTAKALNRWVSGSVIPTIGRLGGGVNSLQVVAHYSCRTRNSQPGAKISEHGKGHAIDISAINLNNGSSLTVLSDWKKRAEGKLLRSLHQSACGPFGTVLGPNSDRYHQDHFHFDTARYRSGSYCR
ncbi:MAG: extensin family protein [Paracoccaceae bacterium]